MSSILPRCKQALSPTGERRWSYIVPFVLLACVPLWVAWTHYTQVPILDSWTVEAKPWLEYRNGAPFWETIHAQSNDSRHDLPKLLMFANIHFTQWDQRVGALMATVFGILAAAMLLPLARRTWPERPWLAWALALGCAALALSPQHWLNWFWGIQMCYTLTVLGAVGVITALSSQVPVGWRLAGAVAIAVAGSLSFVAGLLAWFAGMAVLVFRAVVEMEGQHRRRNWVHLSVWVLIMSAVFALYFLGYQKGTIAHQPSLLSQVLGEPWSYVKYFLQLVGAPLTDPRPLWDRRESYELQVVMAITLALMTLALLAAFFVLLWRQRKEETARRSIPWLVLACWALAVGALIALGRTSIAWSEPLERRYQVFLMWFYIGLTGLIFLQPGRIWRVAVRPAWLVLLAVGGSFGAWSGILEAAYEKQRTQLSAVVLAMRHAAPEPHMAGLLPSLEPRIIEVHDRMDAEGLLPVRTIRGTPEDVLETATSDDHRGGLARGEVNAAGVVELRGWAMHNHTREAADGVVITGQREGGPEAWLGIAQRRIRDARVSKKEGARAFEDRVGWQYSRSAAPESDVAPNSGLARMIPMPSGKVTFRAYAMHAKSGTFTPLEGSITLEVPAVPPQPEAAVGEASVPAS